MNFLTFTVVQGIIFVESKHNRKDKIIDNYYYLINSMKESVILTNNPYGDQDITKVKEIREEFLHLWNSYINRAWGHDFISDDDDGSSDSINFAISMISSIGTLDILQMKTEIPKIEGFLSKIHKCPYGSYRYADIYSQIIGSIASGYYLTNSASLLKRLFAVVDCLPLSNSFENLYEIATGHIHTKLSLSVSQTFNIHTFSGLLLESTVLSSLTGSISWATRMVSLLDSLMEKSSMKGLLYDDYTLPTHESVDSRVSFENGGLSIYYTFLKMNLLTHHSFPKLMKQYMEAVYTMSEKLVYFKDNKTAFLLKQSNGTLEDIASFDSAFVPTMLLLTPDLNETERLFFENLSLCLLNGYLEMMEINANGLPPHSVRVKNGFKIVSNKYEFSPSILETLLYFYRHKHDDRCRKAAWKLFQAVKKSCKNEYGYVSVITSKSGKKTTVRDGEISPKTFSAFFKYMYLIFSDSLEFDIEKYVFSSEGHPFLKWDVSHYGLEIGSFKDEGRKFVF